MDGRFVFLFILLTSLEVFSAPPPPPSPPSPPYRIFPVKEEWYYTRSFNLSMSKIMNVKHRKLNYTRYFQKIANERHEEIVKQMGNAKEIKRS
ncbi:hypothetical protein PRIPAC_85576 [Pristionchus pacificus]|uniref:Uncharacterized protein n=1 Tax=Pristionchus pacificus TaxID=54126 RepID=A0A2A6BLR6_PRIPA|nr:hypothetical protein PRIPAC_85576 [Pristionchus pacificus]|eukprot:PDM66753.1 hypothetical protein PRIPAC_48170 [Pristionchus pacificus]